MERIKTIFARIMDLPNAYRVLQIMDTGGCFFKEAENISGLYQIIVPYYVSKQDAEDLSAIVQGKNNYQRRSLLWWKLIFRDIRSGCRPWQCWYRWDIEE